MKRAFTSPARMGPAITVGPAAVVLIVREPIVYLLGPDDAEDTFTTEVDAAYAATIAP